MIRQEVRVFSFPICCASNADADGYKHENEEENNRMMESLEEGFRLFSTHTMVLNNAGYLVCTLTKNTHKE